MLDEQEAARRAKRGDREAFEDLVRRYEAVAFRAAYLIVREEAEAQDVAQEAFVRAYRSMRRFDARKPFRPWLLRIVTNLALNSVRGAKRRREASERYERAQAAPPAEPSPEASAIGAEEAQRLWAAIGELDGQDQRLIYLRYFIDASEQETAAVLSKPVGTVKSRLHRALRRLRDIVERRYPELAPRLPGREEARSGA